MPVFTSASITLHGLAVCTRTSDARADIKPCPPVAGSNGGSETGDFTVVVQYHAPCVLPWVWDAARPAGSGTLQSQPIPLRAGADGASGGDEYPACQDTGLKLQRA